MKILLVDNNRESLFSCKAMIEKAFSIVIVLTSMDVQEGFDIAKKEEPDVIIIDMELAEMGAFHLCERLKKDKSLSDIPLIFLYSTKNDRKSRIKALECGAEAFLSKPIDEIELTAQIRAMVKIRAVSPEKNIKNPKTDQILIEAIFESIPGILYVYDESGRLVKWNKKHEKMTGYTGDELCDMTIEKWFDENDRIKVRNTIHDIFNKGYGTVEADLILKSGERLKSSFSGAPLFLNGNKYFVGIGIDITQQKKMEHEIRQSEEKFQLLFNKAPIGYQSLDSEGFFLEVNQQWLDTMGYSRNEVIGKWFGDFLCPEYLEAFGKRFSEFKNQGQIHSEFEMIKKDGKRLIIAFEGKIGYNDKGDFKQTHCVLQDITQQRKVENELRESEERYKILFENSGVGIGHFTSEGVVVSFNKKAISNIGGKLEDYVGKSVREFLPKEDAERLLQSIKKAVSSDQVEEYEYYMDFKEKEKWFSRIVSRVENVAGEVVGVQVAALEITDRKKFEKELLYLSHTDILTGLYNRRFFEEELKRLDTKQNLPLSIIICDVNGLKLVNDSFGHDSGDALLKMTAQTIKKACREGDIVTRIGGDEFVVILPKTTTEESEIIANHIKELASEEKIANIVLSVSTGYDTKTTEKQSITETIANAENYMYRHKLYERSSVRSRTIDLIMNTLFEKSDRESAHSNRVSNICYAISSKMDFTKDGQNQMKIAGLIHDIGKIGIDERILNKAGRLTVQERSEIERHPEIGWRLISTTNEFSELAQFVLNHHERFDGKGYPSGLKGNEIQLEARIISVADAYDAMTSERSYREGLSKEEAIKELINCSGSQFDPEVVDIFVNQVLPYNTDFEGDLPSITYKEA